MISCVARRWVAPPQLAYREIGMFRSALVLGTLGLLALAPPARAGVIVQTQTLGTSGRFEKTAGANAGQTGAVLPFNTQFFMTFDATGTNAADPNVPVNSFILVIPDPADPFNGTQLAGGIQIFDDDNSSVTSATANLVGNTLTISVAGGPTDDDTDFSRLGVPENVPSITDSFGEYLSYQFDLVLTGVTVTTNAFGDMEVSGYTGASGTFTGVFENLPYSGFSNPTDNDTDPSLDGTYQFTVLIGSPFVAAVPAPPAVVLMGVGAGVLAVARRVRKARA